LNAGINGLSHFVFSIQGTRVGNPTPRVAATFCKIFMAAISQNNDARTKSAKPPHLRIKYFCSKKNPVTPKRTFVVYFEN
jgi:hypothetical protein